MKNNNKTYNIIATILLITLTIFLLTKNTTEPIEEKIIQIPLQELSTTAKFFEEEINGVTIKYFAVKDEDGNVKTAFDACDVCYNSRKGYRQEGEYMICNNCGNKYHISGLGTQNKRGGGCWPSYLESEINEENLEIKLTNLAQGTYKFN